MYFAHQTSFIHVFYETRSFLKKLLVSKLDAPSMKFNECKYFLEETLNFHVVVKLVKGEKKKRNTLNNVYRTEMNLVPIIMHYCLLQFDA